MFSGKKTSSDRVIPVRQPNDTQNSLLETPIASKLDPYVQSMQYLLGCSQQQLTKERVLFFSSTSAKNSYAQRDFGIKSSYKLKVQRKLSCIKELEFSRSDRKDNFYYNLLAWSDSDRFFVSTSNKECESQIYSALASGEKSFVFKTERNIWMTSLTAEANDKILSAWNDGSVRTYVAERPEPIESFSTDANAEIESIIYLNTQNTIFGVMKNVNLVFQHDFRQRTPLINCFSTNQPIALTFNNQSCLAIGSNVNLVSLWDIRNMNQPFGIMTEHSSGVKAITFDPKDSSKLISGGGINCKRLFQTNIYKIEPCLLAETDGQITGVHWLAPDNNFLVSSHSYVNCSVKLWPTQRNIIWDPDSVVSINSERTLSMAGSKTSNVFAVMTNSSRLMFFSVRGAAKDKNDDTITLEPDTHSIR